MDVLRSADRRVLWWAIALWIALWVIGLLWVMRGVENPLDARAQNIDSFEAADGATIEFNGRDGYLSVPAGTENAEQIASDIADIRGVRDVEIEVLGTVEPAEEPEPVDEAEPTLTPADFGVDWTTDTAAGSGSVPDGTASEYNELFGTGDGLADDATRDLSPDVAAALEERIAPLIGTDLAEGSLRVADNQITVTGVATDQATADRIASDLADIDFVTVDIAAPEPEPEPEPETDPGDSAQSALDELLALDKIEFVSGTAVPTEATESIIDEVATTLDEFPDVKIVISGHTDSRGGEAANQLLSEQRAQAVVDGLIARGIDSGRLVASGKGETEPIDTNDTADGQQRNRRVEIDVEENA